ncbi:MAG TPA: hypothetical protein PLK94_11830 [Alphaproteobacteria bacterium]|nr:hypothetical protein [Alphaproteobacteria bacterium]HOO51968.1 hypothetical protein [Alphaproteobacteria bacterium]
MKIIPPHLRKLTLIITIMILAFIAFATIIEISKETSKELTRDATKSIEKE